MLLSRVGTGKPTSFPGSRGELVFAGGGGGGGRWGEKEGGTKSIKLDP